ncbi:MAG TPA: hypothetical protein VN181_00030, partial [Thermoanaerobaculia bacterium]|nr:hypothetical protein [Thermoanaerobaculia bacterium]
MAGFDFATEISNATFTKIFKANVQIGGVSLNPPFQLGLAGGTAQLIVDDLQLDFQGDDSLDISLAFSRSSVGLPHDPGTVGIGPRIIAPLDGVIVINVLVKLVPGFSTQRNVVGDTSSAVVRVEYSAASEQLIASRLAAAAVAGFKSLILDSITQLVRSVTNIPFGFGFPVVPDADGTLTPGIQFSNLQLRCVGHPDRGRQALCLLGNLFASTQKNGNRALKTETAILPGEDFTTTLSRQVIHSLIFCPSVASSLSLVGKPLPVASLPTPCGNAPSLELNDLVLKSLLDSYAEGAILVFGMLEKSGPCYEVTGRFNGRVEVAVAPNRTALTFKATFAEPEVDVSIDWYCELAGFAVHPLTVAVAVYLEDLMAHFVTTLAATTLGGALFSGPGFGGQLAPAGATFSSVVLTQTHLSVQGKIAVFVPFVDSTKSVTIVSTSSAVELTAAIQGEWKTKVSCKPEKSYTYTETQQKQVGTYDLEARLVTLPLSAKYSIQGGERGIGGLPAQAGPAIALPPAGLFNLTDGWKT